jgi:chromosomal replication initiator protein
VLASTLYEPFGVSYSARTACHSRQPVPPACWTLARRRQNVRLQRVVDGVHVADDNGTSQGVDDAVRLWSNCSASLREQVPEPAWNMWLAPLSPVAAVGTSLVLAAPSTYVKEVVSSRFLSLIHSTLATTTSDVERTVDLVVHDPPATDGGSAVVVLPGTHQPSEAHQGGDLDVETRRAADRQTQTAHATAHAAGEQRPDGRTLVAALNPRLTFEAFVIGASNRFAHAAAQRVAEEPGRAYNPLFVYGGSGLGKTHLEHAIGNYVVAQYPNLKVCYVSTETFLNDFIEAIRTKGQTAFKRRYRAYDVLLVDDIQVLESKHETQEEFFYTFNSLYEAEKQVVISSDRHPRNIATLEERLRSRFESGLITDITPPELETRLAILRKKAESERVSIPDEVLELVATLITDNIRELEGAFIRLAAFASIHEVPITLALAQEALADVLTASELPHVSPAQILEATAKYYNFSIEQLCGPSRSRPLVAARQMAMYLIRDMTAQSFPAIAKVLGGRDHTTVMHGYNKVAALMREKRSIYDQVTELTHKVRAAQ